MCARERQQLLAAEQGTSFILHVAAFVMLCLFGIFSVDFGMYFAAQNQLQTAAEAASLAGAQALMDPTLPNASARQQAAIAAAIDYAAQNTELADLTPEDVELGYVAPAARKIDEDTFAPNPDDPTLAFTGGVNAVRVRARATGDNGSPLPSVFLQLLGVDTMDVASASAAVMLDGAIASMNGAGSGLRPVFACQAQYNAAIADGNISNNKVRIYGKTFSMDGASLSGCPESPSGNWGLADLSIKNGVRTMGGTGANDIGDWFAKGFPGPVELGNYYGVKTGNDINAGPVREALDALIRDKVEITLPLISNDFGGNGHNAQAKVVGFVGFVITGYDAGGSKGNNTNDNCVAQAKKPESPFSQPLLASLTLPVRMLDEILFQPAYAASKKNTTTSTSGSGGSSNVTPTANQSSSSTTNSTTVSTGSGGGSVNVTSGGTSSNTTDSTTVSTGGGSSVNVSSGGTGTTNTETVSTSAGGNVNASSAGGNGNGKSNGNGNSSSNGNGNGGSNGNSSSSSTSASGTTGTTGTGTSTSGGSDSAASVTVISGTTVTNGNANSNSNGNGNGNGNSGGGASTSTSSGTSSGTTSNASSGNGNGNGNGSSSSGNGGGSAGGGGGKCTTGSDSGYIEGYFVHYKCNNACGTGAASTATNVQALPTGVIKLRLIR